MTTYAHTVNLALALNIVVFDDGGHKIDEFIFPFALLFISLPGLLYGWLRAAFVGLADFASALLPGGWREDLRFMALAVSTLFQPAARRYAAL